MFSNNAKALLLFGVSVCAGIAVTLRSAPIQTVQIEPLFGGAPVVRANVDVLKKPETFTTELSSMERDLDADIQEFMAIVEDPRFDGARCEALLKETYEKLLNATPEDFARGTRARNNYAAHGAHYVQELFDARVELRHRLGELAAKKKLTDGCVESARELFRASRILEDLLGEVALGFPQYNQKKRVSVLRGNSPWMVLNANVGKFSLKSGDVILSRGTAFTSAAISRIGNGDTNFSHLALVYVDPRTQKITLSEAHIEVGSFNGSLGDYLTDGKTRAAVFRYKDPILAARAAEMMRDKISSYQAEHVENIPYDFAMDPDEPSKLFCSELISHAFDLAKGSSAAIPMFRSHVNPENRDFLNRLGVSVKRTFLPGDVEFDPNFELIAEWRDYSRMNESHMHDAVLAVMFEWMDREGYVLKNSTMTNVKKNAVWHLRRWPLFSKALKDKLPRNMPKATIGLVMTLDSVSEHLYDYLALRNTDHYKRTGNWLTPKQMEDVLEAYRRTGARELHTRFGPPD